MADVVFPRFPYFCCFQGIVLPCTGECGRIFGWLQVVFSLTQGLTQFFGEKGFAICPACVFVGEIEDGLHSDEEEECQDSCVFWGPDESVRAPLVAHPARISSNLFG